MTLLYADSSAIASAYLPDEPDHRRLRALLLESGDSIVTSELARVEMASAIASAGRTGRAPGWQDLLTRVEVDFEAGGPIGLLELHREVVMPTAYRLVTEHRLRTLDAIHLAVAIEEGPRIAVGEPVEFVTRDSDQAAAARDLGLLVR